MSIVGGKAYRQHQTFKEAIRGRDNHTCQLCGELGYEVDRIIPYAISQETRPEGVRVLCVRCNRATRRTRIDANPHRTLADWYAYLEAELEQC